jgi:hypothetical protein
MSDAHTPDLATLSPKKTEGLSGDHPGVVLKSGGFGGEVIGAAWIGLPVAQAKEEVARGCAQGVV